MPIDLNTTSYTKYNDALTFLKNLSISKTLFISVVTTNTTTFNIDDTLKSQSLICPTQNNNIIFLSN